LTINELLKILVCSIITVRRRLKEWHAHTSYNKNGCYYTLPSIPEFNKKGIWNYQGILFSKYGTLKNTIIELARKSKKGLSHFELEEIIRMNPKCFMARFKNIPGLNKEKHKRQVIYFSSDPNVYKTQKEKRFPPEPPTLKLPPDTISIIILVELIHNPGISVDELSTRLQNKGHKIEVNTIRNLLEHYNISKKKL
jgi:hypothetical protein